MAAGKFHVRKINDEVEQDISEVLASYHRRLVTHSPKCHRSCHGNQENHSPRHLRRANIMTRSYHGSSEVSHSHSNSTLQSTESTDYGRNHMAGLQEIVLSPVKQSQQHPNGFIQNGHQLQQQADTITDGVGVGNGLPRSGGAPQSNGLELGLNGDVPRGFRAEAPPPRSNGLELGLNGDVPRGLRAEAPPPRNNGLELGLNGDLPRGLRAEAPPPRSNGLELGLNGDVLRGLRTEAPPPRSNGLELGLNGDVPRGLRAEAPPPRSNGLELGLNGDVPRGLRAKLLRGSRLDYRAVNQQNGQQGYSNTGDLYNPEAGKQAVCLRRVIRPPTSPLVERRDVTSRPPRPITTPPEILQLDRQNPLQSPEGRQSLPETKKFGKAALSKTKSFDTQSLTLSPTTQRRSEKSQGLHRFNSMSPTLGRKNADKISPSSLRKSVILRTSRKSEPSSNDACHGCGFPIGDDNRVCVTNRAGNRVLFHGECFKCSIPTDEQRTVRRLIRRRVTRRLI